ncbi:kinetochore component CENP-S-domain-containing protein [Lipomyces tetrasporus]|uniref:Kinetochore component CENP-S-domain-containing protein n=1 Tax=Lipomyces tetrasporus TaxID=54092 RepID=A0AAD7VQE4_9ASCO|nr:kinetochore component CENP-S-domain-containing protein [Lipomyces tetrasporus]KAJ8097509.1 kinetochore component CENP-S-domain-containing protein [Lipomyces tetrasporus]
MSVAPDNELRQRLKSAIWYTVGKIVDEECLQLNVNATPQYIAALTELVYTQAVTLATDIESFAHHARRKVISTEDVLMMCRRNDGLRDVLEEFVEELESKKREQKNASKALG